MPSISYVTPEELNGVISRLERLERHLAIYIETTDDEVDTRTAMRITGIKSRDTLIKERKRPGTLIRWSTHGTRVSYSRKSCIDYKLARRMRYTLQ